MIACGKIVILFCCILFPVVVVTGSPVVSTSHSEEAVAVEKSLFFFRYLLMKQIDNVTSAQNFAMLENLAKLHNSWLLSQELNTVQDGSEEDIKLLTVKVVLGKTIEDTCKMLKLGTADQCSQKLKRLYLLSDLLKNVKDLKEAFHKINKSGIGDIDNNDWITNIACDKSVPTEVATVIINSLPQQYKGMINQCN